MPCGWSKRPTAFGWMSWRILITDLQWSWDEAEQWLAQRGIDAPLKPARPGP
jgi:hypothetical protein